jgi:hypothetical protein
MDQSRLTDAATILANTRGLTTLCHHLADKGVLSADEFELIRHDHLHQFDVVFATAGLSADEREGLATRREAIDMMWHRDDGSGS